MFNINVKDGTNAGWRTVNSPRQPWECPECKIMLAKHWTRCPDCGLEPERG